MLEPPIVAAKNRGLLKKFSRLPKGMTIAKSFAVMARNRIIIGVLNEVDPEEKIPRAQWMWVLSSLTIVTLKMLLSNPGLPPS